MIRDKLVEEFTDRQQYDTNQRLRGVFEQADLGAADFQPPSFGMLSEYNLVLKLGVSFSSNQASHRHQREKAERVLLHSLYKDVIEELYVIQGISHDVKVEKQIADLIHKLRAG